jgi:hypothetical protein
MAAPTVGLTIIKRFTYRGNTMEEFSNSYWLTGPTPADSAAWRALFDALVTQEKTCYPTVVNVVAGYGYDSVAEHAHAVWSVDLTASPNVIVPGVAAATVSELGAGDTAVWVRWSLDKLNSKGKRVYLRKYFHPALGTSGTPDTTQAGIKTALNAFGAKMEDGSFLAGRKITDTAGTATIGHSAGSFTTTRTLKRRGKRPPT